MKIDDIIVESRARSQTGWLDDLERSIEQLGVLQPIGVTPENVLIFGGRRLQACKNLGMVEIPARVIDIDSSDPVTALRMEQAENNIRKDFTPMEKVEIARRIEEAMAGRAGGDRKSSCKILQNDAPKGSSRDIAAQAVGWSGEQYRKAKTVFDEAPDEVKKAVDSGKKSVHKAYTEVKKPAAPKRRVWKLTLDPDSAESLNELADKIVEEVDEVLAIAIAERILSRYGNLEVEK